MKYFACLVGCMSSWNTALSEMVFVMKCDIGTMTGRSKDFQGDSVGYNYSLRLK